MQIRAATENDIPQLKQVKPGLEDWHIAQRLAAQTEGKARFFVVEDQEELTSFVFLKYNGKLTHPDYPDLEDLFTRIDKRRQGYARALLLACEDHVRQCGYQKIGLAAGIDLADPGRQLYEQLGYRHDGGASYVDGIYDGVEDWVVDMEKELSESDDGNNPD